MNDSIDAEDLVAATEMQRNEAQSKHALALARNAALVRENAALKQEIEDLKSKLPKE